MREIKINLKLKKNHKMMKNFFIRRLKCDSSLPSLPARMNKEKKEKKQRLTSWKIVVEKVCRTSNSYLSKEKEEEVTLAENQWMRAGQDKPADSSKFSTMKKLTLLANRITLKKRRWNLIFAKVCEFFFDERVKRIRH